MFKKFKKLYLFLIIGILLVILLGVSYFVLFPKVEKRLIKHDISNIVDKINNKEVVTIKKKKYIINNKKLYNSVLSYLEDISSNTNYINNLYNDKKFNNILIINNKDFNDNKEYIKGIKEELDKRIESIKNSDKYNYIGKLDKESISLINNYYMDKDIDKSTYENSYNILIKNIDYINKNIEFLESNNDHYEIKDGKIIFSKRSSYNGYEELNKSREDIFVKVNNYELIKDETPPNIEAEDITIYTGNSVDIKSKVRCIDDVDDEVECIISGEYNVNKVGTYTINISSKDSSGNESSKSINLNVKSYVPKGNSSKPYYIEVVRNQNVVIIYGLDSNNNYTRVVNVFVASVGRPGAVTPTGTFTTTKENRWAGLYGGVYGQYTTRIVGAILFHSVPYFSENPGDLEWEEYNKLGSAVSAGCVRLRVIDAKWIYDNCPTGTTVRIYDGDLPSGISKPSAAKLSSDNPNKGWDPTDPDPNNPWK